MDEILCLCMEAEINIQNISYEILKEEYASLTMKVTNSSSGNCSTSSSSSSSTTTSSSSTASKEAEKTFLEKFMEAVKKFFTKVLEAMARTATRILTLSKRMNMFGMNSDISKKMTDILVPQYDLNIIMTWAATAIRNIDQMKNPNVEVNSFKEFIKSRNAKANKNDEYVLTNYADEKSVLNQYKSAVSFVKGEYKRIQNKYKYFYSKEYEKGIGKEVLKLIFKVQKEAISEIQQRTNIAIKYITTAIKRSYAPGLTYRKL